MKFIFVNPFEVSLRRKWPLAQEGHEVAAGRPQPFPSRASPGWLIMFVPIQRLGKAVSQGIYNKGIVRHARPFSVFSCLPFMEGMKAGQVEEKFQPASPDSGRLWRWRLDEA